MPRTLTTDPAFYTGFSKRKFVLVKPQSKLDPAGSVTNYPKLFKITADSDIAAELSSAKLAFTNYAGTLIPHGLYPSSDAANGTLIVRAKTTVLADEDHYLALNYDDAGTDQDDKAGVVDNGYVLFMPMEEDPSGSAPQMFDWVSESNVGTSAGSMTSGDLVAGQVANGLDFDGSDDLVEVPDSASLDVAANSTIEFHTFVRSVADGTILSKFNGVGGGNDNRGFRLDGGSFFITEASTNRIDLVTWATINTWHAISLTLNGSLGGEGYVDGISRATATFTGTWFNTARALRLGKPEAQFFNSGTDSFDGILDELRISSVARDADWIAYAYEDDFNNADTFELSEEFEAPATGAYFSGADNAVVRMGDIHCTIAAWVKLTTKRTGGIIAHRSTGGATQNYMLYYDAAADRFKFRVSADGASVSATTTASSFGAPSTGVWYFVQGTHDPSGNTIGISVNAGTVDTAAHSGGIHAAAGTFSLGEDTLASSLDGAIDEISIHKNTPVTAAGITKLYQYGAALHFTAYGGTTVQDPELAQATTITEEAFTPTTTVYTPDLQFGAITVTTGAFTPATTVYTPDLQFGAITVTAGAFTPTTIVQTPNLQLSITLTPNHISSTVVQTPDVQASITLTPNHIAATTVVQTPDVTVGAAALVVGAFTPTTVVQTPDLQLGAVTVTTGAFTPTTVVQTPVVNAITTVAPDHIAATTVVRTPDLQLSITLTPDPIDNTTVYTPDVVGGAVVLAADFIPAGTVVRTPDLQFGSITVDIGAYSPTTTVRTPDLQISISLVPNFIAAGTTVRTPDIQFGAVTRTPDFIAATTVVREPIVTAGEAVLEPSHIAAGTVVNQPTLQTTISVTPTPFSSTVLQTPQVLRGAVTLVPEAIVDLAQVATPNITTTLSLSVELIASSTVVQTPGISNILTLTPSAWATSTVVYTPMLGRGNAIELFNTPLVYELFTGLF